MSNIIEVVPYNPDWPRLFGIEAAAIKEALGDNCLIIHHIGSTAVPDLVAKPIIDIIPVVKNIELVDQCNDSMKALGYEPKGEFGIIFRRYFQKSINVLANIHVYEEGNEEIKRHLKFRDWMRHNPTDRETYAHLKQQLAEQFPNDITAYCLGKEDFVNTIDIKTGWHGIRIVKALTPKEWSATKTFRQKYFFDNAGIQDPYTWTFNHPEHEHLVLYQGTEVIGYTHIQLWPNKRAAIRIIVIDEPKRNRSFGSQFLALCEKWLKCRNYQSIHIAASPKEKP